MRALVTGFDAFDGERVNPAAEALSRLAPLLGALTVLTRELPTSFARALPLLERAVAETEPDIVLAVGQAGGRAELSLERVAINLQDARIADNDGNRPIDRPVVAGGPAAYFATLPIKAAVAELRRAGIPAAVSHSAGTFVCNHVFYGLMHLAAMGRPGLRAGFLHLPYLPGQAVLKPGMPSMAIEGVVRGIEIVLAVAARRTDDLPVAEGALD
jgi:pyroglutamyl-peptidase